MYCSKSCMLQANTNCEEQRMATHILVECPELIASVKVGVLELLAPLERQGKCEVRFQRTSALSKRDLQWCDTLVCVRGCESFNYSVIKACRQMGRFVLYYLDDDLLHVPEHSGSYQFYHNKDIQFFLKACIKNSDCLCGVNSLLLEAYSRWGTSPAVLTKAPFCLSKAERKGGSDCIKIVYAGSTDHLRIVRELLCPVFERLKREFGDAVDITVIGPKVDVRDAGWGHVVGFMDSYEQYRNYMESGQFDIGLAPVYDTMFYRCKYYNKFLEYTSIGAVTICTDGMPYASIVIDRQNGFLCGNTVEQWYEAICTAVRDPILRKNCLEQARHMIEAQFHPQAVAEQLEMEIPQLTSHHAPQWDLKDIRLPNGRTAFYKARVRQLWHQYWIACIPIMVWKFIKKVWKRIRGALRAS